VEPNTQSDAPLREAMRAVAAGEANAFRLIAEALEPRLQRFYAQFGVQETDRDDLYQETCVRLYRAAASYDSRRPFLPWALTVARRVMLNWHRARKPTVPLDEAREVAAVPRAPNAHAEADLWRFARERMPTASYELLWLCYGEDLKPSEIAAVTGRTAVHVRVLLHRARAVLVLALEKAGELDTVVKRGER
jgi:RNA polymerase sigma-70 factor (ECF subfamily)